MGERENGKVGTADDRLTARIEAHVRTLCAAGDRQPGTARNRRAALYVAEELAALGVEVETLEFETPEWTYGDASLDAAGCSLALHPGPYSAGAEGAGPLVAIDSAEALSDLPVAPGSVLLLHGDIAAEQFTPRDYPWYSNPDHTRCLDALEAVRPLAVIAATDRSAMAGGLSPFPLIEDPSFAVPSAYMHVDELSRLLPLVGKEVRVRIDSATKPSSGTQPIGRIAGSGERRIIVASHVDSKPDTPGALDNAAGVATMLAVAELLAGGALVPTIEFLPFNGEDHATSPGEVAYLAKYPDLGDVRLMVNVDAAGYRGGPSAVSTFGLPEALEASVARLLGEYDDVEPGEQWYASDHMIFAMRGIPAVAVTSRDFHRLSREITHTPADAPELVDPRLLASAARFIAALVREVG